MRARFLQRLPILSCAGFLGVMLLVNIWNAAVSTDWPKLRIRSADPLWGVKPPKPADWTLDGFLSGETQKAVSKRLGQTQPVFPISVRIKNQLLFSVFGVSGAPDIFIGSEGELFEKLYLEEFCGRGAAPDPAALEAWAAKLRAIQDALQARGKGFVYLISPSKAAGRSEFLPKHMVCRALARGTTEKLTPYRAALESHGVSYVDGPKLMATAAPDYPISLFPRGGTHWSYLGGAVAARELTRRLNDGGRASGIPDYDFEWRPLAEAGRTDIDLLKLLNLLWPDKSFPTAAVIGRSTGACGRTPKLFAAGGSFTIEPIVDLVEASCGTLVDYWHYIRSGDGFRRLRYLVDNMEALEHELEPQRQTAADFEKGLLSADAVLLEENEVFIGEMRQIADVQAILTR